MKKKILKTISVLFLAALFLNGCGNSGSTSSVSESISEVADNSEISESGTVSDSGATASDSIETAEAAESGEWSDTLIAHALGGIDENIYTNSLEAFELAYSNGFRTFEADMLLTSDNEVVLYHDWDAEAKADYSAGYIPTLDEFLSSKTDGIYTRLSFLDLLHLMEEYPDIWIVTDSKYSDAESVENQFTAMYNTALENDLLYLFDRIVVQIYNEEMKSVVDNIYEFDNYIFTMYQIWDGTDISAFDSYCKWSTENGVNSICMYNTVYSSEANEIIQNYGLNLYVHTVNDASEAFHYLVNGATGIYTQFLTK